MHHKILTATIAAAILCLFAIVALAVRDARAQGAMCGPVAQVISQLDKKFNEVPAMLGTGGEDWPFTMYANRKTGTWTFTFLTPEKQLCIMAEGNNYEDVPPPAPGDPL